MTDLERTQYPDILARAKAALWDSAKNVFVLRAGAFADFRLDAPPNTVWTEIDEEAFEAVEKNGRRYAKMKRFWYENFIGEWNTYPLNVDFLSEWEVKFKTIPPGVFDQAAAACSLFLSISNSAGGERKEAECNFALLRKIMDVPYILASRPLRETVCHLFTLADELRIANARSLALHKGSAGIRACAISLSTFLSDAISSV